MDIFNETIKSKLSILDNKYINIGIILLLIVYVTMFSKHNRFDRHMNNNVFKFILLITIAFISKKDMTIALLLTCAFVIKYSKSNKSESFEDNTYSKINNDNP